MIVLPSVVAAPDTALDVSVNVGAAGSTKATVVVTAVVLNKVPVLGADRVKLTPSPVSTRVSNVAATTMVCVTTPGAKVSVPVVA